MKETQKTRVQSLGQEDPLEEQTATHSSILAWIISWIEEPGGLQTMGLQRVGLNTAQHVLGVQLDTSFRLSSVSPCSIIIPVLLMKLLWQDNASGHCENGRSIFLIIQLDTS